MADRPLHRRILALAGPIILANLSIPLLSAVDTAVIGHFGAAHHMAGLALGAVVLSTLYWGFGFLRMGTTGFAAQALGAGDLTELGNSYARASILGLGIAALVLSIQWPIGAAAFSLLEGSPSALDAGQNYYKIRIWGAPAALTNFIIVGWLIGVQQARAALLIQIFMNGLNALLDIVFVVKLGWGVAGIAAGTLIAEYSALVLGIIIIRQQLKNLGAVIEPAAIWKIEGFRRLGAVNSNIFIRTAFLISAFAIFTREGSRLGDVILAANLILLNLQSFLSYGLDGFAQAAEALVGREVGAKDRQALRQVVKATSVWALIAAALYAIVYCTAGSVIITLFTNIETVQNTAIRYLPWLVVSPLISVWCFQFDGIYIGAQRTKEMRNMMAVAFAAFLAALFTLPPLWGNHGLWAAMMVFFAVRGVTLALHYPAVEKTAQLA